jgi:glycosyltransferase involved in cell wall biosynthesis
MPGTVLFAANRVYALSNSRKQLIEHFLNAQWRVVLATADHDASPLDDLPVHRVHAPFQRGRPAPIQEWNAFRCMKKICRVWQPNLIQQFHPRPIILGSLAARSELGASVRIVNTITGLGNMLDGGAIRTAIASRGFRSALSASDITIFQNPDDRNIFLQRKWVADHATKLIVGSGVDLDQFQLVDRSRRNNGAPTIVIATRLIAKKGIPEFAAVAKRIRKQWPKATFLVAGECERTHPDAIQEEWVRSQSHIEYVGHVTDIRSFLARADLLLYPSSYREGVPRVVMEAAATGLPAVAFDVPGVREAIRHDVTGRLVPCGNLDAMTEAVADILGSEDLKISLGTAARQLAEQAFDVRTVQGKYIGIYQQLGFSI